MKFLLGSDLHLAFNVSGVYNAIPQSHPDTLIIAGDTVEYSALIKKNTRGNEVRALLDHFNSKFKNVVYILGNHCYWGSDFRYTVSNIKDFFKRQGWNNIHVLEQETITIEDTIIFGATMWTTMRARNPLVVNSCGYSMNDYREIFIKEWEMKSSIFPENTIARCESTLRKIKDFDKLDTQLKKVLLTHMAPSCLSVHPNFKDDSMNDAYFEELGDMLSYSNIKMAIHGHMHHLNDYQLGDCRVVSNPRGYAGSESIANNYKFLEFEV